MSLRYAILIDGGFLKRRWYNAHRQHITGPDLSAFINTVRQHEHVRPHRLHRAYFYDAKPFSESVTRPLDKKVEQFGVSPTAVRNRKLQSELIKTPFLSLRMGEIACNGWRIKIGRLKKAAGTVTLGPDDLEPNIQQKGVDMRIGLDIASLTLKKQIDIVVLVTGDSDFVPAMKFARREGAQLLLVTLGQGVKEPMQEHADALLEVALPPPTQPPPAPKKPAKPLPP